MLFEKIRPSKDLQAYVKYYWFVTIGEEDLPFSQHLLPYSWCQLFFHLQYSPDLQFWDKSIPVSSAQSIFSGQLSKPAYLHYTKPCKCFGISLQAWAGKSLFNIPAYEFTDRLTDLKDLDKDCTLADRLLGATSDREIADSAEKYLFEKLGNHTIDKTSQVISQSILLNPSVQGYKDVTSTIGFTRRRVEQRFLESTGVSMGHFVRATRFENVLQLLADNNLHSLTQLGLSAGYYDQSHFTREFKSFAGLTPKAFLKSSEIMGEAEKYLTIG